MKKPASKALYDARVVAKAEELKRRALADLFNSATRPRGVVIAAPAGAGKTQLSSEAACMARDLGLRTALMAPTNEQCFGNLRRLLSLFASRRPADPVCFLRANDTVVPADLLKEPQLRIVTAAEANRAGLVVGTVSKFGWTHADLEPFDVILFDEAYQTDSAKYYGVAGLAPLHLLVGDNGQIDTFSTIADPHRWRGFPEDPLQNSVGILTRNYPDTPVHGMPISRRLDGRAIRVAQAFYPSLPFEAAVLPGVRELRLKDRNSLDRQGKAIDKALSLAAKGGWAQIDLPRAPTLPADPETVELIAALVARLLDGDTHLRCERLSSRSLQMEQVAVGVSHNDQKALLRCALDAKGLRGVMVETANTLQGLEFEVVVAWHPLAGLPEPDGFHLEPGRLCVLLTRHRQACIVVGREGDRELLEDYLPPSTPAYLGHDAVPVLDGWEIHAAVYDRLEPLRVTV
jgi:hypothetical protein